MAATLIRTLLGWSLPGSKRASCAVWAKTDSATPTLVELQALADALVVMYDGSSYQADLDSNTVLTSAEAQTFQVISVPVSQTYPYGRRNQPVSIALFGDGTPIAGGVSSTAGPPPAVTMGVTLITATAGRRYRGRVYLPGLTEASVDESGDWTSGAVDDANALVVDWVAAINAASPTMAAVVHGLAGPTDTPVVGTIGRLQSHSQRRRNRTRD